MIFRHNAGQFLLPIQPQQKARELKVREAAFVAPKLNVPKFNIINAERSKPIETLSPIKAIAIQLGVSDIPIPLKKPSP